MAITAQNIYLTKKEKLHCFKCGKHIKKGDAFVGKDEKSYGTCFTCSSFKNYSLLPPGDAALTRRSKKYSELCGVVFEWNKRRKRFERKGQYVQMEAIEKAKAECDADAQKRALKNQKAAVVREVKDKEYVLAFAEAIRNSYPNCPKNREHAIAQHACEKYSGRVGRTANAKQFDKEMIDLAVEAHIRHTETNYDSEFGKGKAKREIRSNVRYDIDKILKKWERRM